MKGLSIQPPFVSPTLSSTLVSEPSSPSFIKPQIPAMKRKPSQLSLKTSTHDLVKATTLEIQSPVMSLPPILQRRALKHSTSSPHMLSSLKSATFGPAGGMTFPTVLERNESGLSEFLRPSRPTAPIVGFDSTILEEDSPIKTQIANRAAYEFEPYHEHENNEDQKTPGYPDGPIAIYGDNVFLYLEPTAEEASRFDVVINVAREVQNPFEFGFGFGRKSFQALSRLEPILEPPSEPSSAVEKEPSSRLVPPTFLFIPAETTASAQDDINTPTTPKASQQLKEPEYIHIPWDHNTDIGADLMMLCETIERKTKDGKKVLVHCQQGASRSASLIIAYGMYQNPDLSVNDAYYAAQAKSRWISPNMRLMYCLQDFQKEVAKKRASPGGPSVLRPRSGRSPTKHHRTVLSADAIDMAPKEPLSAPLPAEEGSASGSARGSASGGGPGSSFLSPERSPMRPRGNSTPNSRDGISPGPSSAPSSFSWAEKEDENDRHKFGRFPANVPPIPTISHQPSLPVLEPLRSLETKPFLGKINLAPPPGLELGKLGNSGKLGKLGLPAGPTLAPPPGAFGRPPPSPGFAAHRFGGPPMLGLSSKGSFTLSNGSNSSVRESNSSHSENDKEEKTEDVSTANLLSSFSNSFSFGDFSLFSPGLPPRGFGDGPHGLDDIVMNASASFASRAAATNPPLPRAQEPPAAEPAAAPAAAPALSAPALSAPPADRVVPVRPSYPVDTAEDELLSPRVETMTNNPLREPFAEMAGLRFVEVPPTPLTNEFFSPRETMFPRDPFAPFGRPPQVADPRSPPTKGETPIIRSIDDLI